MKIIAWWNLAFLLICSISPCLSEIVVRNSFLRKNFADKEHPGRCVIPELDLILSAGVIKNPDPTTCEQIYCSSDGMTMFIKCPPLFVEDEDNCWMGELTSAHLPFPECCRREIHCSAKHDRRDKRRSSNGSRTSRIL